MLKVSTTSIHFRFTVLDVALPEQSLLFQSSGKLPIINPDTSTCMRRLFFRELCTAAGQRNGRTEINSLASVPKGKISVEGGYATPGRDYQKNKKLKQKAGTKTNEK